MSYKAVRSICRKTIDRRLDLKEKDLSVTIGAIPMGSLDTYELTSIAQGMEQEKREGLRIRIKSIFFQGYVGVESEPAFVRVAIVWANFEAEVTMAAPTMGAIWNTVGTDGTFGPRHLGQTTNWIIIWERRYQLTQSTNYMLPIKIYKKLDHIVKYFSFGSTDASRGKMWMIATSDSASSPHPAIGGQCRVRFMDD